MRPFISPNRHNRVFRLLTRPILTVLAVVSLGWSVFLDLEGSTKWALTAAGCLTIVMTLLSLDRSDKLTDRKVRKRSAQTLRWDLGPRTAPGLGLPVLTGVEEARDIVRLVGANASDCARILSNLGHETYELGWLVLVDDDTDGSTHATSHPLLEQWTREKLNRTERSGDFKYHRVVIIKDADRLPEGRIEAWQAWVGDSIRNHVVIAEPLRSPAAPDADIATASGGANGNSGGRSLTTVRTTSDTANNPAAAARDGRSLFPLVDLSMIRVSALRRDSRVMARISFRALLWVGAFVGIAVLFGAPHSRQPSQLALSSFHAFFTVLAIAWVAVRLAWPEAHHVRARTLIFESVAIYVALTFATSLSSMLQAAFLVSCFTIARLLLDPRFRPAIDLGPQSLCTAGGLVVVWFALVDADSSAMLVATLYLLCTLCRPTTRLLWFTAAAAGTYGLDLLQTDGLSHIFSTNAKYRLSVVLGLGCAILLANATALMQAQLPLPTGLFLVAGSLMIWFVVRPTAVVVTHGVTADRYLTQTLVDRNLAIFGWMVAFWVGSTVLQRLRVRSLPSLFTVGVVSVAPVALVNSEFSDLLRPELLGSVAVGGVVLSLVVFYCIRASDDRLAPLKVCLGGAAAMAGWLATSVSTIGPAVIALGLPRLLVCQRVGRGRDLASIRGGRCGRPGRDLFPRPALVGVGGLGTCRRARGHDQAASVHSRSGDASRGPVNHRRGRALVAHREAFGLRLRDADHHKRSSLQGVDAGLADGPTVATGDHTVRGDLGGADPGDFRVGLPPAGPRGRDRRGEPSGSLPRQRDAGSHIRVGPDRFAP